MMKIMKAQYDKSKVPEITPYFWTIKVLTTAMGESVSDYLVFHINPYPAVIFGAFGFVLALILQFSVRRYIAWVYWFVVLMVAVFGTMAADVLHVVLGIPYVVTTSGFAISVAVILVIWYATEKTLSIHSIFTFRREIFYWAAVSATFALGTAAGDMTATTFGLGYLVSGLLFTALIFAMLGGHIVKTGFLRRLQRQPREDVFFFWLAYILTRPLGASFADWMGKPVSWGALGWGDDTAAILFFIPMFFLVWHMASSRTDIKEQITTPQEEDGLAYPSK